MKLNEYRERIPLTEMAEHLGYERVSGPMARNLTYILGNRKNPEDEIVIFPEKNSYFSRKGIGTDKGNLINFIQNRRHLFPMCTQSDNMAAVHEILGKYLNNESNVVHHKPTVSKPEQAIHFDINYWNPKPIKSDNSYLINRRKLSPKTVEDFSSRLFIYTAGNNEHIAFPFRKLGQMEIVNFEMRNYFPKTNTNYKGFCAGGDKSNSCWIANFVPFDKVTDIYLFESAIDAMSFYEIKHFSKETTSAFISTGGNVTNSQIEKINSFFPCDKIKWKCCYDNDGPGNSFDVATAYFLKGKECKVYTKTDQGNDYKTVYLSFPNNESYSYKEGDFSSVEFLDARNFDNIEIIKPERGKDWNELLTYYKRFDLNLSPTKEVGRAIDTIASQLNLQGYHQLADVILANSSDIVASFSQRSSSNTPVSSFTNVEILSTGAKNLYGDIAIYKIDDKPTAILENLCIKDSSTGLTEPFKTGGIDISKQPADQIKKLLTGSKIQTTNAATGITQMIGLNKTPMGWGLSIGKQIFNTADSSAEIG